ncbi:hypothetical protein LDENG_00214000 [Lucifuga dentata]|nr:hypothetical protein LDENG_00214000 [Lucifuga dentata]
MRCVKNFWDEEDQKEIYSCPQCRQTFTPRPLLVKNTMLADLVEKLKKTELQAAAADLCYAGPADVGCDVCKGRKQIRSQQETEVSRAEELQEKMQQEIKDLRRKDAELQQLSLTDDHVHFLHNYLSVSRLREPTDSASIKIRPLRYFEDVTSSVSELRDKLQNILTEEWTKISETLTDVDVLLPQPEPEPKTRAGFLKYFHQITPDPNTANMHVSLWNRQATWMKQQSYSSHPDRFINRYQVLSRESLTRRCYWEVEWSGMGVRIAVAYKDIRRTGDESRFGFNDKSWALHFSIHDNTSSYISVRTRVSGPRSSRLGVYLDHRAGILSFYSVSENMTLLHRVQTTFTQPLYAGLCLYDHGDAVEFM